MYKKHKIAVIIPCFNESSFIESTLHGIPEFVDQVIVVDDSSQDNSVEIIQKIKTEKSKIKLLRHKTNLGNGKSCLDGFEMGVTQKADILTVFAGDNQMDPNVLPSLLDRIIDGKADLAKGNRFFHLADLKSMPKLRIFGNIITSLLAKYCTGYWSVADPLNGYIALRKIIFVRLDKSRIAHRYDFEASLLIELSIVRARVKDVYIPARYGDEKSDLSPLVDTARIFRTFIKGYFRRIFIRYLLLSFHPVALFSLSGIILIVFGSCFSLWVIITTVGLNYATSATTMLAVTPLILGFQFLLQGIALDIADEPK